MLTIGTDDCCGGQYGVASRMATDPELNASIDILGGHCTGLSKRVLVSAAPALNAIGPCSAILSRR